MAPLLIATLSASAVQSPATKALNAANAFISTLTSTQRQSVVFAYDDEQQRTRWSNFPISIVPRKGLNMGELSTSQRAAAMTLLSTVLSPRGFEKVQQIMDADEAKLLSRIAQHGSWIVGTLFLISLLCWSLRNMRIKGVIQ